MFARILIKLRSYQIDVLILFGLVSGNLVSCANLPNDRDNGWTDKKEPVMLEVTQFSLSENQLNFSVKISNNTNEDISLPSTFKCHDLVFGIDFLDNEYQSIRSSMLECKTSLSQVQFVEIRAKDCVELSYDVQNHYEVNSTPVFVKVHLASASYYDSVHAKKSISAKLWTEIIEAPYFRL